MSTPEQAGPTRPARLAGIGLIALALIALVIGLIQLLGGGDPDQAAPPPPSSESQPPPPPPTSETPTSVPPPPATSATSTVPPATSTTSSVAPPPPAQTPAPNRSEPVRVYNNSFIEGLAERAANDFRGGGWNVVDTGPHQGKVPVTTVYYRPGTAEEAQAKELAQQFGLRAEPRFDGIQAASPGIIVIVTKEYNPKSK